MIITTNLVRAAQDSDKFRNVEKSWGSLHPKMKNTRTPMTTSLDK